MRNRHPENTVTTRHAENTVTIRHVASTVTAAVVLIGLGLSPGHAAAAPPAPAPADRQPAPAGRTVKPATHTNPMKLNLPGGYTAASCADPDVIHGSGTDTGWYLYCTSDRGTDAPGGPEPGLLPIYRSTDLVNWTYLHASFPTPPGFAAPGAGIWAPDVVKVGSQYRLYFAVSDTNLPGAGAAIGLATGPTPAGPFTVEQTPVVEPGDVPGSPGVRRSTIDPEVVTDAGHSYIVYGGFGGGLSIRDLSTDGKHSDPASMKQLAVGDRYEGAYLKKHGGWWYLLASSTNCCNGPLTGYTVFAARAKSVTGPFLDRDGRSVLAARVGGTPVVAQNGNTWVGVGHNTMLTDLSGQDWMIYHGIDKDSPYYQGAVGYTKRPGLIDPVDWIGGWPTVRAGNGPSDTPQPGPVAQAGERPGYHPHRYRDPRPGARLKRLTDEFTGGTLGTQWSWVREPDPDTYTVAGGKLTWQTQAGDLQPPSASLPAVLTEDAPAGDYLVDTKVSMSVPAQGAGHNYVQGGLAIYNDDAEYVKLVSVSIGATRQIEIGKHVSPKPGYPAYGNGVVGPQGSSTYLRLVSRGCKATTCYTAYSSLDGRHWDRGATWTQDAGAHTRIALLSMAGAGFTSQFDYVRVSRLR